MHAPLDSPTALKKGQWRAARAASLWRDVTKQTHIHTAACKAPTLSGAPRISAGAASGRSTSYSRKIFS